MIYTKKGEWPFVTQYCPKCGSENIECDGKDEDFFCCDCGNVFDVVNYELIP